MTKVSFYHLSFLPVEKTVPKLLEKSRSLGYRSILYLSNQDLVNKYDEILWTYNSRSFLAHGTEKTGFTELQPIYITHKEEIPNKANCFFTIEGLKPFNIKNFERIIDVVDGVDENQLNQARIRYKAYKELGYIIDYWKQKEDASWEKLY